MFVLFLLQQSQCAVFGFDFGSEYIKTAMSLLSRGVHVALNQQSKRLSPSYFAFWNKTNPRNTNPPEHWNLSQIEEMNWAFLDAAKSHSLRFPNHGAQGLGDLLKNELGFTRREILALMLRHLITTVDNGKWKPSSAKVVFAVEPYTTRRQRRALYEAVSLSEANLTAILDSPTAAALVYALEKHALYATNNRTIVFIDIGARATWAAVFRFENSNTTDPLAYEIAIVRNETLGGNLIDQKLSDRLIEKFGEKDLPKKVVRRLIEESRRAKEILSINKDVEIKIDDVMEDRGLYLSLNRSEFNSLIPEFNESLRTLYSNLLSEANLSTSDIDGIELVGGTTRVPLIQDILLEVSGLEKLNRTMNSDEAIALGAGYKCASQSSAFVVKKIKMSTFCTSNVSIKFIDSTDQNDHNTLNLAEENPKIIKTQLFDDKMRMTVIPNITIPIPYANLTQLWEQDEIEEKEEAARLEAIRLAEEAAEEERRKKAEEEEKKKAKEEEQSKFSFLDKIFHKNKKSSEPTSENIENQTLETNETIDASNNTEEINMTEEINETENVIEKEIIRKPHFVNTTISIIADDEELYRFTFAAPAGSENATLSFGFDEFTQPAIVNIIVDNNITVDLKQAYYQYADFSLTKEEALKSIEFIDRMDQVLIERRKFEAIQNDYESYIYKIKDRLEYDAPFKKVVSDEEKEKITEALTNHSNWMNDTPNSEKNYSIISDRLDELKQLCKAAEKRAEEIVKRAPAFDRLNKTILEVEKALFVDWPKEKPWLNENKTLTLRQSLNETKQWFEEKYNAQQNLSNTEDPIVYASEIESHINYLEWDFKAAKKIKEPTPTPTPIPEVNATDVNSTNVNSTDINSTNANFTDSNVTGVNNTQTNTPDLNSTETNDNPSLETNEPKKEEKKEDAEGINQTKDL